MVKSRLPDIIKEYSYKITLFYHWQLVPFTYVSESFYDSDSCVTDGETRHC